MSTPTTWAGARQRGPEAATAPPLLMLRALGLGDLLTAVPALRALAHAFPDRRRVLAAPRALAPLVALVGVERARAPGVGERAIDALVDLPAWVNPRVAPDPRTAARLPAGTIAVNLHGRGPQSHRLLLATRPRRLIAFASPTVPGPPTGPPWDEDEHEVTRWCRLLAAHRIVADPDALDLVLPGVIRTPDGPTLLHPGATSPARRWPPQRWAAVAEGERARGRRVLITGSEAEVGPARAIADAAGLPSSAVLAGRTTLRELIELVARAGRVVCGDTGVAHLATALRTPSVVLFGPTSPAAWGPPPGRPWHRALWRGHGGDPHAAWTDSGLLKLVPDDVLTALARLPEPAAPEYGESSSSATGALHVSPS